MAGGVRMSSWQSRIVGSGTEEPGQLLANPRNWRVHNDLQRSAIKAVLDEVGWVQNVIVNRLTGYIVDGHLRVGVALERGEAEVPVVYVELSEEEEALILATLDPIGGMATTDQEMLNSLLAEVETDNPALQALIDSLVVDAEGPLEETEEQGLTDDDDVPGEPGPGRGLHRPHLPGDPDHFASPGLHLAFQEGVHGFNQDIRPLAFPGRRRLTEHHRGAPEDFLRALVQAFAQASGVQQRQSKGFGRAHGYGHPHPQLRPPLGVPRIARPLVFGKVGLAFHPGTLHPDVPIGSIYPQPLGKGLGAVALIVDPNGQVLQPRPQARQAGAERVTVLMV